MRPVAALVALIAVGALAVGLVALGRPSATPVAPPPAPGRGWESDPNDPARCAACHPTETARWQAGGHAHSVRPATRASVGMPVPGVAALGPEPHIATVTEGSSGLVMRCLDAGGAILDHPVSHVIGGSQLEMYLTAYGPDARPQVLPAMWSRRERAFVPYWDIDFTRAAAPVAWDSPRFWTERSRSFASYCNRCHSPRTGVAYDPEAGRYTIDWGRPSDVGVSCAACHGDAAAHAAAAEQGMREPPPPLVHPDPEPLPVPAVESCCLCHTSAEWVSLDFKPGGEFFDTFLPILLDDEQHMWPDGRYKDHAYLYLGHVLSGCYQRGTMRCQDCHEVHGSHTLAEAEARTLAACARCHPRHPGACDVHVRVDAPGHVRDCNTCHMPELPIERGHGRMHDHRVSVPDPGLTRLTGIPNACGDCHTDRTPAWAEAALAQWGARTPRNREWAVALSRGLAGAPDAGAALLATLGDEKIPWPARATAARLLARFPGPEAAVALADRIRGDAHPMVRASAAYGLVTQAREIALPALRAALRDRRRVGRVMAAGALIACGEPADVPDAIRELETVAAAIPDHLEMHRLLAQGYERAGDVARARQSWDRAVRLAPRDPGLAAARAACGRPGDAGSPR